MATNIDWLHRLLTMPIIGIVFLGLERTGVCQLSLRARRTGVLVAIPFPLLLLFNVL